jgi:hypothetical protein
MNTRKLEQLICETRTYEASGQWHAGQRRNRSVTHRPRDYQISYTLTYGAPDRHSEQLISNTLIYTEHLTAEHRPTEYLTAAHRPTEHLKAAQRPTRHLTAAHRQGTPNQCHAGLQRT